jgi:uncharacterized protein YciI
VNESNQKTNQWFLLFYDVVDDYLEKRVAHRKEHVALAKQYVESGSLVLGGAFEEPADGAVLAFNVGSEEEVKEFAESDPYVKHGVVTEYKIRKWKVVVGTACSDPLVL